MTKPIMRQIKRKGDSYMIEGNSQRFDSIAKASKFQRNAEKAKKNSKQFNGRRFWSERLQMPFRSNWEITIAELMTDLGIKWEYEPERVYFRGEGESYLCDFFLPDYNCWVEVKGYFDKRSQRRCKLFKKYYGHETGFFLIMKDEMVLLERNPDMMFTLIEIARKEHERIEKQTRKN